MNQKEKKLKKQEKVRKYRTVLIFSMMTNVINNCRKMQNIQIKKFIKNYILV